METYGPSCKIDTLHDERMADRIAQFLLSANSFDDQRHTPGEIVHFRHHPLKSLKQDRYHYWFICNEIDDIIGVLSGFENEQLTGGYTLDYIAVHREYRNRGIASSLIKHMIDYVSSVKGRYILTYTCDLPAYAAIQKLFEKFGFIRSGYCPDYYYNGEGRITFFLKL